VRTTHQICHEMDGEVIILSLKSGTYHSLEGVGAKIWDLVKSPISLTGICDSILNDYEVQTAVCERDVREFIEGLERAGLVQVDNETVV